MSDNMLAEIGIDTQSDSFTIEEMVENVDHVFHDEADTTPQVGALVAASDNGAWRNHAACKGMQEVFLATTHTGFDDSGHLVGETDRSSEKAAKSVCRGCPVVTECLQFEMQFEETFGVVGGFNEWERQQLRSQPGLAEELRSVRDAYGHEGAAKIKEMFEIVGPDVSDLRGMPAPESELSAKWGVPGSVVRRWKMKVDNLVTESESKIHSHRKSSPANRALINCFANGIDRIKYDDVIQIMVRNISDEIVWRNISRDLKHEGVERSVEAAKRQQATRVIHGKLVSKKTVPRRKNPYALRLVKETDSDGVRWLRNLSDQEVATLLTERTASSTNG